MVGVFVDTSAWYAHAVASEPRHEQAVRIFGELQSGGIPLHTTDWVLLETVSLLHRRVGVEVGRRLSSELLAGPPLQVHFLDEETARSAGERYRSSASRVSLVDASSFVLMEKLGLRRAFAFDRDFSAAGFQVEAA